MRTYVGILRAALRDASVDDRGSAADVLRELREVNRRIRINPRDDLAGVNVQRLIETAHHLLGFTPDSLLQPKGQSNE